MTELEVLELLYDLFWQTETRNVGSESYEFSVVDNNDMIRNLRNRILETRKQNGN